MARSKYKKSSTGSPVPAKGEARNDGNEDTNEDTNNETHNTVATDEPATISRSARKRNSEELKAFGMTLAELSPKQLEELAPPQNLLTALTDYQRITSNSARRRQRGYIGGLLRDMGEDADTLRQRHAALTEHDANAKRQHHALEDWRERLLAADSALTEFLDEFPGASAQELRVLIRRARSAKNEQQRKIAERVLYRKLAAIAQA